ncbi:MAG: UDP-N-acetylmuramyl-tripeptide synthetase [Firmicutes bacterium]|nr:UDP-N-acetylmuramyl-tripeptide synthetase [Bacillota bacterium]
MNYAVSDIISKLSGVASVLNQKELSVTGVSYHSGQVKPGDIFVAISGYKLDGHDFIDDAVRKGAVAVVGQQAVDTEAPMIVVVDSRVALAEISHLMYDKPDADLCIIGITASNGKTTTSFMTDHLLSARYKTGLIGTVVVKDGESVVSAELTTPQSKDLIELLAKMRDNNCSHVTMEVSSAGLELKRVLGIKYSIATFNNVSREHIDFHGSFENYWYWKSSLIRELDSDAIAILNADEPKIKDLQHQTKAQVVTYSLKGDPDADFLISEVDLSTTNTSYRLQSLKPVTIGSKKIPALDLRLKLGVLGLHNIYNSTVAVIIALVAGVEPELIQQRLPGFTGVERRFQLIYDGEFAVIDDHFANAGNIDITLETLNMMPYNNLILVAAIRGSRGVIVNTENAETVCKWASKLKLTEIIVTDSAEFTGEKDLVTDAERKAFISILEENGLKVEYHKKLESATDSALKKVCKGDIILLAGCQGMDSGAHVILPKVAATRPDAEQKKILAPLADRVAGNTLT